MGTTKYSTSCLMLLVTYCVFLVTMQVFVHGFNLTLGHLLVGGLFSIGAIENYHVAIYRHPDPPNNADEVSVVQESP